MAEGTDVADETENDETATEPEAAAEREPEVGGPLVAVGLVVKLVTVLFALALVVHLVIAVFTEDAQGGFLDFLAGVAGYLALGIDKLVNFSTESLQNLVGFGVPAILWLVIGVVVERLLRAVASRRASV
ncbi:hypothetical protein LQ327_17765 [Actinomycetospora endophytica]|uniref:Superfamily III holin-X n=1 Tax=Actinomycetospora endophytica TaxID=2291215 RepID=A0ABS8PAA4_9PSEU|nr:hypothetical protein [Actinomycetospora endophytica]MCD2195218.1 hypothetical protein [Actinomycetospora endophytica]